MKRPRAIDPPTIGDRRRSDLGTARSLIPGLARSCHQVATRAVRAVTAMSDLLLVRACKHRSNHPGSHDKADPARFVHGVRPVIPAAFVVLAMASGCVIPPSLSLEENDAAVNSPPVLRDVRDEVGNPFERPGPRDVVVGAGRLVITAADNDLDDTLFVRFYLDYGLVNPTPPKITCQALPGATPTVERQVTCSLIGVCNSGDVGALHVFEIDVYDRMPIDDEPTRVNRSVAAPGEVSTWWWQVDCRETSS